MQENINNNLNNINIPKGNLDGQVVQNKNRLYVKIFAFVVTFLILIGILFYFFYNKSKVVSLPKNDNSFPSLNLGLDRSTETYTDENSNNLGTGDGFIEGDGDIDEVSHIWPKSVAGYNLINIKSGTSTESYVLFMDKETGNIYKTNYPTLETTRLTNTTLQDVTSVKFSKNGDFVVVLKGDGPTYKLVSSRISDSVNSSFIESEVDVKISQITSSKTENIFYYLKKEEGGLTSINSFSPALGKVYKLAEFKFSDIIISGESRNSLFVSSKPTSKVKQFSVIINKNNNTLDYISGSNSNKYELNDIIIRENDGKVSVSGIENYKNKNFLFLNSFIDKCFSVREEYLMCAEDDTYSDEMRVLDLWYSGEISFTDSLTFLKLSDGEKSNIPVSLISNETLDVYNVNASDDFLVFKNKNDESLWLVNLIGL